MHISLRRPAAHAHRSQQLQFTCVTICGALPLICNEYQMQSLLDIIKLQLYAAFADAANLLMLIFAQLQLRVHSQEIPSKCFKANLWGDFDSLNSEFAEVEIDMTFRVHENISKSGHIIMRLYFLRDNDS